LRIPHAESAAASTTGIVVFVASELEPDAMRTTCSAMAQYMGTCSELFNVSNEIRTNVVGRSSRNRLRPKSRVSIANWWSALGRDVFANRSTVESLTYLGLWGLTNVGDDQQDTPDRLLTSTTDVICWKVDGHGEVVDHFY